MFNSLPQCLETFTKVLLLLFSLSVVSGSATPWSVALQAPLAKGFPKQEYWSGLPFLPPGDFPDPGIEPMSPTFPAMAGRFFTTKPPGKYPRGREEDK